MRICKNEECQNVLERGSNNQFCSVKCRKAYHYVPIIKACDLSTCNNYFEANNGNTRYCSKECRDTKEVVVEEEKSELKISQNSTVQDKYNHDYGFVFSSRMEDWLVSLSRTRSMRRRAREKRGNNDIL